MSGFLMLPAELEVANSYLMSKLNITHKDLADYHFLDWNYCDPIFLVEKRHHHQK